MFSNDGVHHAREWPAAEVPIMWAHDLLEAETLDDGDPLDPPRSAGWSDVAT